MSETVEELSRENQDLRSRLEEAEETLHAIRSGHVDAFVVSGPEKDQVFTLESADRPYRLLVEEMQQGALTIGFDGVIFYGNNRFASIVGVPLESLIGSSVYAFVPSSTRAAFEAILREGRSGKSQGELGLRRSDGALVPVYLGVNPLDQDAGLCMIVTDLTELKRTGQLQRLAKISTRLTSVTDFHSVLGVVTGEARNLIGAHQSITSLTTDASGEQAVSAVSYSEKYAEWREVEERFDRDGIASLVCRENQTVRLTHEELEKLPQWRSYQEAVPKKAPLRGWLSAPLLSRDGRNIGLIHLSDPYEGEFTEDQEAILVQLAQMASVALQNARLYDELRQNDRRKDEFLAMLAHELRNPLAAVNNAVTLLKLSPDPEHKNWATDIVERQIRQLVRLIDDLLDVSRITSGKIRLQKVRLDAASVLDQAIESARPLIDERKHELVLSVDRGNLPLKADATRLEQIVVNLLTNAAKYTESGGRIWLTAKKKDEQVVISVRDNGIGIPPEKLPEMFQLFTQGERSIARSEGGLGIGLTIVQKLAEMHGGSVVATSEGPGKGSEFTVRLPAEHGPQAAEAGAEGIRKATRMGTRILVVDDNLDTAQGMVRLLKLHGNDVRMAHDGPSAVQTARGFQPEFVLLDIGLPGMDGYQVAKKLKSDGCCKSSIIIIGVSGYGQEEDRLRSKAAGFDHHLVKPIDFDSLTALLA